jgi:hemerythrin-like metal-binding protein
MQNGSRNAIMPAIPAWNSDLSVGNAHLDDQHRRLLALGARACDMVDGAPGLRSEFHEIINDLAELANRHFIDEEMVLARNDCPSLAAHKQEHEEFRGLLMDVVWKAEQGKLGTAALKEMLQTYLGGHLLDTDLPAKAYMKARR